MKTALLAIYVAFFTVTLALTLAGAKNLGKKLTPSFIATAVFLSATWPAVWAGIAVSAVKDIVRKINLPDK